VNYPNVVPREGHGSRGVRLPRDAWAVLAKEQLAAPAAFELALQVMGIMRQPSWALPKIVKVLAAALGVSLDAGSTATAPVPRVVS
jgi:hypothetical protein